MQVRRGTRRATGDHRWLSRQAEAVVVVASTGASSSGIYPLAGTWHGKNANGKHRLSFKVAASGRRVGNFDPPPR
jgi:hypothetical protein